MVDAPCIETLDQHTEVEELSIKGIPIALAMDRCVPIDP